MTALHDLVGRALPGGRVQVEPHEDWLMRDVALAEPAWAPSLHPLSVFAGLQRSIGITLADFFALCGSSSEAGPMLGGTRIEVLAPMAPGRAYDVRATITGAERKETRSVGPVDIVELSMEALEPGGGGGGGDGSDSDSGNSSDGGAVVARVVNSYVFRRAAR